MGSVHLCDVTHPIFPIRRAEWLLSPVRRAIESPDRLLRPHVHDGDTVIDAGCGPGFFTLPMAEMVGENGMVIAVDVQEGMLSMVARAARERGLLPRLRLHLCRGNSLGLVDQGPHRSSLGSISFTKQRIRVRYFVTCTMR